MGLYASLFHHDHFVGIYMFKFTLIILDNRLI